ncbi:MAG: hypothetical protein KDA60_12120, partial [Planctomycetales bacterium]|nr:hypothetical protein [Planctomycetales bacterium]
MKPRSIRPTRPRARAAAHLQVESLELRRLLAGDVTSPWQVNAIAPAEAIGQAGQEPAQVHGFKWNDLNANHQREADEPGLAGVTVYSDLNNNGLLDDNEPATRTMADDPNTRVDETGYYWLGGLADGTHFIREVVPDGYVQTYPGLIGVPGVNETDPAEGDPGDEFSTVSPSAIRATILPGEVYSAVVSITVHPFIFRPYLLDVVASNPDVELINHSGHQPNGGGGDTTGFEIDIIASSPIQRFTLDFVDVETGEILNSIPVFLAGVGSPGAHVIEIIDGQPVDGIDFGNHNLQPDTGSVAGIKWEDLNADGRRDANEPGLGGVVIYADLNRDGQWGPNEPSTITSYDLPETDFDEGGRYRLGGLPPGEIVIREVVPAGFAQTYPARGAQIVTSTPGEFERAVALQFELTDVSLEVSATGQAVAELDVTVVWPDSCGTIISDATSVAVVGQSVLLNVYGHQVGDACAEVISPQTETIRVELPTMGRFDVIGTLHEQARN